MDAMKKAQEFTTVAKDLQEQLKNTEIETSVRDGQVTIVMTAQSVPLKVEVTDELVAKGSAEVSAAVTEGLVAAYQKSSEYMKEKMGNLTKGKLSCFLFCAGRELVGRVWLCCVSERVCLTADVRCFSSAVSGSVSYFWTYAIVLACSCGLKSHCDDIIGCRVWHSTTSAIKGMYAYLAYSVPVHLRRSLPKKNVVKNGYATCTDTSPAKHLHTQSFNRFVPFPNGTEAAMRAQVHRAPVPRTAHCTQSCLSSRLALATV